ncbi:MAG: cytochrome P450 [Chloroflexi bacterium]|nr:cytochrome P450 [Chloroflexota bacterium]MDA1002753.1 cytochrome P450 [Chloroflexota bacterium]
MVAEKQTHDINLHDVNLFLRDEFHEAFRVLRREAPVHWNPGSARANGFWSLAKYEDILFVSRNPETFISSKGIGGPGERNPRPEDVARAAARPPGEGDSSIITMDPPRHVKMRRLVNKGFTPRAVNAMEPQIRAQTREVLDAVGDRASGDFVLEVSSQLPLAVICGLMGLPREAWPLMFELTNAALGAGDPEYQTAQVGTAGSTEAARATARAGNLRMAQYFREVLEQRRAEPREDLISILLEAELDGEQLTEREILEFCNLLVIAGNETTRNAISGGLVALDEHPDERERLQADMSLIDSAVEEILRWTSPLHHMTREATADVEIRGQQISAGEKVMMWYPSANRDEDVFDDPYRFDITRSPNDHIAFGIGEHFCLGAGFARKEIRVMFEELFDRYPKIRLAGGPDRLRSSFINGIKHLPVDYR